MEIEHDFNFYDFMGVFESFELVFTNGDVGLDGLNVREVINPDAT